MAEVFKKVTTKPLPPGAAVDIVRGRRVANWGSRGKPRSAPVNDAGDRIVVESGKWYGTVDGRQVPLCRDKTAARTMLNKLLTDAVMDRNGFGDPFKEPRRLPLADHLAAWRADMAARGATAKHARLTANRAGRVVAGCGFAVIADMSASRVQQYVGDLKAGGLSVQSANFYLQAVKQFCRWLVKDRRTSDNPVSHLERGNVRLDRRHDRRELTGEEVAALLAATRAAGPLRGLSGGDRAMLYSVALYSGLRASELASLTPASFDLSADSPTVTVGAAYAKNRRADTLPVHPSLAAGLAGWLAVKPPGRPVWPGKWADRAGEMMGRDLAEARDAWLGGAADAAERGRRAASDFLAYRDGDGRYADFHSLRHTFISGLVRAGVTPKVAQTLARHSTITLTMDRYSHTGLHDTAAAVAKLPALAAGGPPAVHPARQEARATRTDGPPVCTEFARTPARPGRKLATPDSEPGDTGVLTGPTQTLVASGVSNRSRPLTAEGEGFEPPVKLLPRRFSRPLP